MYIHPFQQLSQETQRQSQSILELSERSDHWVGLSDLCTDDIDLPKTYWQSVGGCHSSHSIAPMIRHSARAGVAPGYSAGALDTLENMYKPSSERGRLCCRL